MLHADNIIQEVTRRFPAFIISEEIDALPTVVCAFLSQSLLRGITERDIEVKHPFRELINEMSMSSDRVVSSCLSEIVAVLYDNLEKARFEEFLDTLSFPAQAQFRRDVDLWNARPPAAG